MIGGTSIVLLFLPFFLRTSSTEAVDLTCPSQNITNGKGVFPPNTSNVTALPANYFCKIGFVIPKGYAVRLMVRTNIENITLDKFFIFDSLQQKTTFYSASQLYFAPSDYAALSMITQTNNSKFWFQYEFIYIGGFENSILPMASPVAMNLTSNRTYTFTSSKNGQIVLRTGSALFLWDPFLTLIYVYDGPDVNSPYIGTLYGLTLDTKQKSTGISYTLVNLYNSETFSYALANEYSALSKYQSYNFRVFSTQQPIHDFIGNANMDIIAYTYYCSDCDQIYMSSLSMVPDSINVRTVKFLPLTPSDVPTAELTYFSLGSDLSSCVPQLIPGKLITMVTNAQNVYLQLESTEEVKKNWTTPYFGRRGAIFSPSLWNPTGVSSFNYNFSSSTTMKFIFNLESVVITQPNEQITVQIGSQGVNPSTTTFNQSVSNPGVRVANGTFLSTVFTSSSSQSSSIVTFDMDSIGNLGTTVTPVETTTSVSRQTFEYMFPFVSVVILKLFTC